VDEPVVSGVGKGVEREMCDLTVESYARSRMLRTSIPSERSSREAWRESWRSFKEESMGGGLGLRWCWKENWAVGGRG